MVRHTAPAITAGTCYGRLDLDLSPTGYAAIPAILADIADFPASALWSSPARRCRHLTDALAEQYGLAPVIDPRLHELDFGEWEGRAWNEIPRAKLDRWAAAPLDFAPPGGETGRALLARVHAVHADIVAFGATLIVVAHGGPLKLLAALCRGEPPDLLAAAPAIGSVTIIAPPAWSAPRTRP